MSHIVATMTYGYSGLLALSGGLTNIRYIANLSDTANYKDTSDLDDLRESLINQSQGLLEPDIRRSDLTFSEEFELKCHLHVISFSFQILPD